MKTKPISAISLLLLGAIMTNALISCGSTDPVVDTPDDSGTTSEQVTTEAPEIIRDFEEKTLRVYMTSDYIYQMQADEETGDVSNDAIYRRNQKITEKYNFKIEPIIAGDTGTFNVWNSLATSVMAGDDAYDLAGHYAYNYIDALSKGKTLVNWLEVPNINLDEPWWSKEINDGTTINGKLYGISGYLSTTLMQMTYGIYFNDKLIGNYGLSDTSLYKTVEDGKWTIDYLATIVKSMYSDLNGDGKRDINDQYGFASMPDNSPDIFLAAFDQPITDHDKDGYLSVVVNTEKTADIINKVLDLYYNNEGAVNLETLTSYVTNGANKYFANGQLVFCPSTFLAAFSTYRDMDSEYGILPPPKWDEEQEKYYSHVQDKFTAWGIPVTATDLDFIGFVTDALCRETYETVYPIFYDIALKDKYSKDQDAAKMVDLIMEGVTFDAGWIFGQKALGDIQCCVRKAIKNNDPNFASAYASTVMKLDDLVEMYK